MKNIALILTTLIVVISCNRMKEEGENLIDKSKRKAKQAWQDAVDNALKATTHSEISFESSFGKTDSLKVTEIKGLKIDYAVSFYAGFLKYKADKDTIVNYFSTLKTRLPDISDDAAQLTNTGEILEILKRIKKDDPGFYKKLDFFLEFKNLNNCTVYKCNKYPLMHHLIIDEESRTIYHYYENYWD